jgi:3-oxoacyl-(acyl-carrier-protein) synthase/pimeloyl-ACP methyl ester carboxylesterase
MRRVVVTGVGIVAPSGVGHRNFWRTNMAGRTYLRHEPFMDEIGMKSHVVSDLAGFDVARYHRPADAEALGQLSRFVQFGATAGIMAARDGGLPGAAIDRDRAGVVSSSAIGGTPEFQAAYEDLSDAGTVPVRAFPDGSRFYDSVFLNYTPSWLARTLDLRGPCTSLTTGCTAGIDALGLGFELVRHGDADVVLSGAAEAPLSGIAYATLDIIGSLAVGDFDPARASRPFDATRGGFVLGEGAAAVVLEEYEHALRRGARIYAEVLGFASGNNAFHMTDLSPDGQAMAHVLERVLAEAGIAPTDIDYVNAHGSSTPQNDLFETRALKTVLGAHAYRVPISSTKSMIGHSLSAASLTATVALLGAMRYGVVPPTANYEFPDPDLDLDYVPNEARPHDVGTGVVMASGFGGIHSSAVLRRVAATAPASWSELGLVRTSTGTLVAAPAAPEPPKWTDAVAPAPPGPMWTPVRSERDPMWTDGLVSGPAPADAAYTLLLLHGFGGTARQWEPLLAALPRDVAAIAVDLPGHGNSPLPLDVPTGEVTDLLADLLDAHGAGRVGVVGHSLAGMLALQLALREPDRVGWLSLVATAGQIQLHPHLVSQLAAGVVDADFVAGSFADGAPPALAALVTADFARLRLAGADTDAWGLRGGDLLAAAAGLVVPTQVVVPELDSVVSPRKGRALAAAIPGAVLEVIPGTGHYPHLERPAALAALLTAFAAVPA